VSKGYQVTNIERDRYFPTTQLTADAVEDIVLKKPDNPNGDTVMIFSGDQDMCPLIRKARNYGWNVEVWTYTDTVPDVFKWEPKHINGSRTLKMMPLEIHFKEFAFYDNKDFSNSDIPEDRALLLT